MSQLTDSQAVIRVTPTSTKMEQADGTFVTGPTYTSKGPAIFDPKQAAKFDTGKPRFSLIPARALEMVAKVFTYGANKYAVGNWHSGKGFTWSRLQDASDRHGKAFALGENNDPESDLHHLAHRICCDMMLLEHALTKLGTDDRDKTQLIQNQ